MEEDGGGPKKQHRKRAAGPKADKKKKGKGVIDPTQTAKQRNPKAFAVKSVVKLRKQVARSQDKAENRLHPLDIDRSSAEPPPVLVAIVGPPKVGKSTLMRCLVRNFTKRKINNIQGPITIVTGKKQRVTLIECNNDVNCMIDVAKVCDLALLLIDASFGLEMEVMEFLEMCRTHGMPKIIGVLTHLDMIKNTKQLQRTKKQMKHRLWTELYQGAKLFYLSGMVNDEYQKTEIHNLARFISVQKYRPIEWRSSHPYIIADRMEDVTDPETLRVNPKSDRTICLYGYVRGTHFRKKSEVHIPGCGDLHIDEMSFLSDPCPLATTIKKCSLNEKDRLIYAPWSGVGGVMWDKDAVYIDLGGSHSLKPLSETEPGKPSNELVSSILDAHTTVNEKLAQSGIQLFSNAPPVSANELMRNSNFATRKEEIDGSIRKKRMAVFDDENGDDNNTDSSNDDDDSDEQSMELEESGDDDDDDNESEDDAEDSESDDDDDEDSQPANKRPKLIANNKKKDGDDFESEESNSEEEREEDEAMPRWKKDVSSKAVEAFQRRKNQSTNWQKLVYDNVEDAKSDKTSSEEKLGGLFKILAEGSSKGTVNNDIETTRRSVNVSTLNIENLLAAIKDCFVTGQWDRDEDAETRLKQDAEDDNDDEDLDGDFIDLETGEVHRKDDKEDEEEQEDSDAESDESGSDKESSSKGVPVSHENETPAERRTRMIAEKRLRKKARTKAMFDNEYDEKDGGGTKTAHEHLRDELNQQTQLNRAEFEGLSQEARIEFEGFRPGLYVRVQIKNVPCELVVNFDPTYPMIIGGLLSGEQNIGYVNTRLKKHRWHKKILKTTDPLIVSLGWRRFQTIAMFSMRDDNGRYRYIKYTPEHLHCYCTFWGPITPQGKGMLSIRNVGKADAGFRISSTGSVLEVDKAISVVKKLKCIGTPFKIFSKTAFIKDMFTSSLEVTKFEGGKIQTVSGIRGIIKKAVKEGAAGSFRATFEDKILLSDIVFFKTWRIVPIPQLYNLVTTLLLPASEKDKWLEMKTVGQLRRERSLKRTVNIDHLYKPIERREKVVRPLVIPRQLQKELPFKDKPKVLSKKRDEVQSKRVAIVREPKERKVAQVMKMLRTIYEQKRKQDRVIMRQRAADHQKQQAKIDASKAVKQKARAKHAYFMLGQAEKRKQSAHHDG